jgi:hypothetical protein
MTSPPAGDDYRRSVYPVTIDGPRVPGPVNDTMPIRG